MLLSDKTKAFGWLIAAIVISNAYTSLLGAALRPFANSYALVIGVDNYPSSTWPSLEYAKKDAEAMVSFLESQGYQVRTLFDAQATRARILRELRSYLRNLTACGQ